MLRQYKKMITVIITLLFLYACVHHHDKKESNREIIVTKTSVSSVLYYSSMIEPLKTVVITAPTDGVIDETFFHFGDEVKRGQTLFFISSDKFQADYKSALMQYIKAKTDYANGQTQMREGEFLHKNQLISDDDYKSKQTGFYNAQLSLIQAKDALDNLQKQIDLRGVNLSDLKIENIDKIAQVLHEQNALREIHIVSVASGTVLLPNKDESGSGELKKIAKGDAVKQGDVVAVVGDVSGLTLHIYVSEFNVNQIKPGQWVKVTGVAFPEDVLDGKITAIDHQGMAVQGGLPVFSVEVSVPTLTRKQQALIHMGMSAKVAIELNNAAKMTIPIQAIFQKNGKEYVKVKDEKSKKIHERLVKTGETTLDSVVIESGLLPGEKIAFSDPIA